MGTFENGSLKEVKCEYTCIYTQGVLSVGVCERASQSLCASHSRSAIV